MSPPLAHAGHWLVNLLYVAPVATLVLALAWQSFKERRRNVEDEHNS
jgi:hypothetical protein